MMTAERREVTILMSDLRGFTSIFESVEPEKTIEFLNRYLDEMVEIIERFDGTVIEFIGDAILAVFGAPRAMADQIERAAACAIAMQRKMPKINRKNRDESLPEIEMGIGLHTGEVVAGNIGSSKRVKYGVIGKEMRLASHVASSAVGGRILVSGAMFRKAEKALVAKRAGEIEVKGFEQAVTLYDLHGINGRFALHLP